MKKYTLLYMQYTSVAVLGFFWGWVAFVADALPFEKESKGSVSFAATDFKPLSCPCPYGWTVVPEGNVQTQYLWLSASL